MNEVRQIIEELAGKYLEWWRPAGDGKNIQAPCPFHAESTKGAFYISITTGMFICHSCQARGSLITFLKELDAPPKLRATILNSVGDQLFSKARREKLKKDALSKHTPLNESLLGLFDYCPTDLVRAGFDKDLLRKYDIGFDKQHMRITFPIRNHFGVLMGISGRTVVGDYPRYKIYKGKEFSKFSDRYPDYHFEKKYFLWNMHNVYPSAFFGDEAEPIIAVEGYKAALWMIQNGFKNTVAFMGTYMSLMQQVLLQRINSPIFLFLDNTDSARKGVYEAGIKLREGSKVRVCNYPHHCNDGAQPDSLTNEEIKAVVKESVDWNRWRRRYESHQKQF
jgi:DNA primase